ncbi:MAG: hypothetical protein GC158_05450 [Cyanobacteria bacterium RI_101]|nr:hypothetical protein [Cyanobacteria bacterium RI_101]
MPALTWSLSANAEDYQTEFSGVLKVGKQYSHIFYSGKETGDTVAYFFENKSKVGQKILSTCKNNKPCSGSGNTEIEDKIPKEIPETTSGTYKITSISKVQPR